MNGYSLKKYINKRFLSLKLQKKIFLGFFILILSVVLLTGGLASLVAYKALLKNTINYGKDYLVQYSETLEYKTERLLNNTYSLMSDKELLKILNKKDVETESINLLRKKVREIGRRYLTKDAEVQAFYIVDNSDRLYWCGKYGEEAGTQLKDKTGAKELVKNLEEKIKDVQGEKIWDYQKEDGRVYLGRTLFDPAYVKKKLATIVFVIDNEFWTGSQADYTGNQNKQVFYHKQSNMYYSDSEEAMEQTSGQKWKKTDEKIEVKKTTDSKKQKYLLMIYRGGNSEVWDIFYYIPETGILADIVSLVVRIAIIACLIIMAALYVSYYLAGNMVENLNRLEKNMQKVEEGNFHIRIKPSSYDEVGMLCMRFNFMANKIEELVQKAYEDGVSQQKLEMQVLKAQINPHFLYNTLGSIKCIAKMKGQEEIVEMTTVLIDLLRTSLSKKSEFRKVKDEIAYVKGYFLLQRYRYGDLFKVRYELDSEVDEFVILDFLLQPLVENALFHGIDMLEEDGIITVKSYVKNGCLILSVEDNGVGMSDEQMTDILKFNSKKYEGLNSIGVHNVNERIKKYFGTDYGLRYRKAECGGTVVDVILPILHTEEEARQCLKF